MEKVQFILTWVFGIFWWRALNVGLAFLKSQSFISRVFQISYWNYFFFFKLLRGKYFYDPVCLYSLSSYFSHLSLLIQFRNLNYYHITVSEERPRKATAVCTVTVRHEPSFHYGHIMAWGFGCLMVFLEAGWLSYHSFFIDAYCQKWIF